MKAYTLKEHNESGELHLFEGDMYINNPDFKCNSKSKSICNKMEKSESKLNKFSCKTEQEAREKIAKIGRKVCGICVSHLYESY
ncbi:hypothetical protein BV921_22320 [Pectobacterium odoriferum]|uniref:hypothetical protein n=1 Tax=Pectobacterium odoriferum TaxID=78398 RepID=UPI000CD12D57|nr:hypothetical protein [Pectobacterium odoriferum]POE06869.1 hypothetical protein BV921_22320 [Pectobacterium odoriferum]QHP80894.1 hypothetical protein EO763_13665 [Pectobacterium odoriferum]